MEEPQLHRLSDSELVAYGAEVMRQFCQTTLPLKSADALHDEIWEIALRCPGALHPFLSDYFRQLVRLSSEQGFLGHFDWAIPWRESESANRDFLMDRLENGGAMEREKAVVALLETRHPGCMGDALESLHFSALPPLYQLSPLCPSDYLSHHGDAELRDSNIRFVAPWQTVYHLLFPPDYPFDDSWTDESHPTWQFPVSPVDFRHPFGGIVEDASCAYCGNPLHHILTLTPVPEGIGVSLPSVTLATCLSCLGWEETVLFFRHDDTGNPRPFRREGTGHKSPEFPSPPLVETRVAVLPTPRRWRWQRWSHQENLQRIGGHPVWIQRAEYPLCPDCHRRMGFVLQLDSLLPLEETPEGVDFFLWGSGGLGYFFWCDRCRMSACHWQCT